MSWLLVIIRQDGTEGARNERECNDTSEHDQDAEDALDCCLGGQVTIAHSWCGRDNEVESHDVQLIIIHLVVVGIPQPRVLIIVKLGNENEHACRDVEEEGEKDDEEE